MAERNRKNPSSNVFWRDLRGDEALRRCSLAARGLWTVHGLPCAAESSEFGVLIVGSHPSRLEDLGELFCREVGESAEVTQALFNELAEKGAAELDEKGRVYNRRMVREEAERRSKIEAGRRGGMATQERKRAKRDSSTPPSRPPSRRGSKGGSTGPSGTTSTTEAPQTPVTAGNETTFPDIGQADGKQTESTSASTHRSESEPSSIFSLPSSDHEGRKNGENLDVADSVNNAPDGADAMHLSLTGGRAKAPEFVAFEAWCAAATRHRWRKPRRLDLDRRKAILARIAKAGGIAGFLEVLERAEASEFLRVRMRGWCLDWFLKPANFRKVSEGNYDDDDERPGDDPKRKKGRVETTVDVIRQFEQKEGKYEQ